MKARKNTATSKNTVATESLTMIISTEWMDEAYRSLEEAGLEPDEMVDCNCHAATYVYNDVDGKQELRNLRKSVSGILLGIGVPLKDCRFE